MLARVIGVLSDRYKVNSLDSHDNIFVKSRGKVKRDGNIKVGDIVTLSKIGTEYIIEKTGNRKNDYIRPPVSNIDYMFIVISAGSPKPDFLLLDKQLITTEYNNCIPIIVVNKTDLDDSQHICQYVQNTYGKLGYKIIFTNTISDKLFNEELFKDIPEGSLSAFSGNSGVGKSSIINKIKEEDTELDINSISNKTGKGRHTTKATTIYTVLNNENKIIYFLDTPGFSSYEIFNIASGDLKKYFIEFNEYRCEYDDCNHVNEDVKSCAVKKAIHDGLIDKLRYENYLKIYDEVKQKEKRLYK